mmetsp:Transcript_21811/g.44888  ORF Transcript_21811/g.44888 Transcript_21811/m.44888 type:complete len:492 (+) Transcript_21811:76-1551(+)
MKTFFPRTITHHKLTCNRPVRKKTSVKNNRRYVLVPFPPVAALRLFLLPLCGLWIFGAFASTSSRKSLFGAESYITGLEVETPFPTFFPLSQRLFPPTSQKSRWGWGFILADIFEVKLAKTFTKIKSFGIFTVTDMVASSNPSGANETESQANQIRREQIQHEQLLDQNLENMQQSVFQKSRHPPQQIVNEDRTIGEDGKSSLRSPSYSIPSYFSLDMSTEENYGVESMEFYGPFASIRASLDYSYHGNYEKKRQEFQDQIVQTLLDGTIIQDSNGRVCRTPTEPYIVFTAGVMGAGKSHTIKILSSQGLFPLQSFVSVDPDEIRHQFPEFHLYATLSPEMAGELTHKEAGYVTEIVTEAALQRGHNVLVDGSLRDADWYEGYFESLRRSFKNLKIAILHITAPREAVFERARIRALVTGRVVPRETLEMSLRQVPKSIEKLAPLADFFCELDNAPGDGEIKIRTDGITWDSFRDAWAQTCPWPPNQLGKM